MIKTFADKRTKAVFEDVPIKGIGHDLRRSGRKKLLMLDGAASLADLRVPPNNRLEALKGNREASIASESTTSSGFASCGATAMPTRSR